MAIKHIQVGDLCLLVFALVSVLEIYEVKQSGAKKVFKKVCSYQIDEKNGYLAT